MALYAGNLFTFSDLKGEKTITPQEILDIYWGFWKGKMVALGREDQISEDNCVDDFCIVNYATPIKEGAC